MNELTTVDIEAIANRQRAGSIGDAVWLARELLALRWGMRRWRTRTALDKLFIDAMHGIGVDEPVNLEGCKSSQRSLEELHSHAIARGNQLREAHAEIDRLKGDAERYRWLRSHSWHEPYHIFFGPGCNQTEPWHLDQAIDNEMKYPIIEGEKT